LKFFENKKDFIILDDLGAIAGFEAKDFENVEPKK